MYLYIYRYCWVTWVHQWSSVTGTLALLANVFYWLIDWWTCNHILFELLLCAVVTYCLLNTGILESLAGCIDVLEQSASNWVSLSPSVCGGSWFCWQSTSPYCSSSHVSWKRSPITRQVASYPAVYWIPSHCQCSDSRLCLTSEESATPALWNDMNSLTLYSSQVTSGCTSSCCWCRYFKAHLPATFGRVEFWSVLVHAGQVLTLNCT